jgi:hypothetical protein
LATTDFTTKPTALAVAVVVIMQGEPKLYKPSFIVAYNLKSEGRNWYEFELVGLTVKCL